MGIRSGWDGRRGRGYVRGDFVEGLCQSRFCLNGFCLREFCWRGIIIWGFWGGYYIKRRFRGGDYVWEIMSAVILGQGEGFTHLNVLNVQQYYLVLRRFLTWSLYVGQSPYPYYKKKSVL